jgi:hypothetical protein
MSARSSLPESAAGKWQAACLMEKPRSDESNSRTGVAASGSKKARIVWCESGASTCRSTTAP